MVKKKQSKKSHFGSTMNCRVNRLIGKVTRDVTTNDFISILCNEPLTKKQSQIGYTVRTSKSDILFRKGY